MTRAPTWDERVARLSPAQKTRLAAAIAREQGTAGTGGAQPRVPPATATQLVAYVVPARHGDRLSAADLKAHVATRLPDYMVPAHIIQVDALPRLPNGKVDRQRLPDAQPDAQADATDHAHAYVAPRSDVERLLADIWSRVLGVDTVGIHDDFFELGGDSLLSIQIVAKARQAGMALRPAMLLELPTIAQLAAAVAPTQPAPAARNFADAPASPIQRWLLAQPLARRSHWNQTIVVRCRHRLDPGALRAATTAVFEQHEALRSRFFVEHGEWRWAIGSVPAEPCLHRLLDTSTDSATLSTIEEEAHEWHRSLDVSTGDVCRVVHYDNGTTSWLLMIAHHLVIDVISQGILLDDLMSAYRQLATGARVQLPTPTVSFAAWCHALEARARHPDVLAEAPYWTRPASKASVSLPREHPAGSNAFGHRRELTQALESEVTERLIARFSSGRGLQDALCAALALVLTEWSGASDVTLDVEGHGRSVLGDHLDASRTVGWFTTVHPVRLRVSSSTASQRFEQASAQLREVPGNGEGFGLLRFLGEDRTMRDTLAQTDRAEVVLAYFGQRARVMASDPDVHVLPMPVASDRNGADPRRYLLEVTAWLHGGRLEVVWGYSQAVHERRTMERLAARLEEVLRDRAVEGPGAGPTVVTTGVQLDQDDLDAIARALDLDSEGRP